MVDIHHGYQFETGIVGESHYQDAIKRCYNDPNAVKKGDSVFIDVTLLLENDNPYDNKAVAVISNHGKIGHLSKAYARLYRKEYGESLTVRARIYSRTGSLYGVWVDLPYGGDGYQPSKQSVGQTKKSTPSLFGVMKKIFKL